MSSCCKSTASAVAVDNVPCIVDCRLPEGQEGLPTKCRLLESNEPAEDGRLRAVKCDDSQSCLFDPATGTCHVDEEPCDQPIPGHADAAADEELGDLDWVSKLLTLWVALAMAIGLLISHFAPEVARALQKVSVGDTNVLIAIGLIVMLIPPLAKARYNRIASVAYMRRSWREISISMVQNWIVGPFVMFLLAWAILHDHPGLFDGTVMVGLARCIAMVIIWNQLSGGDKDLCVLIVAVNSMAQLVLFAPYTMIFVVWLGAAVGIPVEGGIEAGEAAGTVAVSVAIYLGIPMAIGFALWWSLRRWKGEQWYYERFIPIIDPMALIALLFTILILFIMKGEDIIANPLDALLVAAPLTLYFLIMFTGSWTVCYLAGFSYARTATLSFTAASNNFELAIAMAIATFGVDSDAAFATVIGPLIEVPVMLLFVHIARFFRKRALRAMAAAAAVEVDGVNGPASDPPSARKGTAKDVPLPSQDNVLEVGTG